ncbi:MAG TPA: metabolite traffic protein EboE [Polyangia bacterium]
MKIGRSGAHLTYCTNIHPGESWDEVKRHLSRHAVAVKSLVSPDAPFGVGLRLSAAAAETASAPNERAALRELLADAGLYVFTINACPYGAFHGEVVKAAVYEPDWRTPERQRYTETSADLLADLIEAAPDAHLFGSISSVPGGFRIHRTADGFEAMARTLAQTAATLFRMRESGRPLIGLALEPEPACAFETTRELTDYLEAHVFGGTGRQTFARLIGVSAGEAERALRRHVGVCLDACHAAVEFETPEEGVDLLASAGISLFKLQVSAGLRIVGPTREKLAALTRFAEGVYLHQTVIRRGDSLERILDLPHALHRYGSVRDEDLGDEWRVHFHVPIFRAELGPFESTNDFLGRLLARAAKKSITSHYEVETYTFDVLPEEYRGEPVETAVARELTWARNALDEQDAHLP